MRPLVLALALVLTLLGCYWRADKLMLTSDGPSGEMQLKIWMHSYTPSINTRISLVKDGKESYVFTGPRGSNRPMWLMEVAWSQENRTVGVLICDSGSPTLLLGFDTENMQELPGRTVEEGIRKNLVARYGLNPESLAEYDGDPIRWACPYGDEPIKRFRAILADGIALPNVEE
jgi:hypothetical protein